MATSEARFFSIGSIVATGLGTFQARNIHRANENVDHLHHNEELKLLRDQHARELFTTKQTYLVNTFTGLEQFCQKLNEDLLKNSREAERDMVDQRNQQFQTLLLASSIMLTALITVLIQGVLPSATPSFFCGSLFIV